MTDPTRSSYRLNVSPLCFCRLCGRKPENTVVTSSSNTMTIKFRSDSSHVHQGFTAEYETFVPNNRKSFTRVLTWRWGTLEAGRQAGIRLILEFCFLIDQLVPEGSGAATTCASTRRCSATVGTTAAMAATRTTAVSPPRVQVQAAATGWSSF